MLQERGLGFYHSSDGETIDLTLEQRTPSGLKMKGNMTIDKIHSDVWQVSDSLINEEFRGKGVGALMYNIALALCTKRALWLTNDREKTSSDAERVWVFWHSRPDLFDQIQLDEDVSGLGGDNYFLTPEKTDDYAMKSFHSRVKFTSLDDPHYRKAFLSSPLTKGYKMINWWSFLSKLKKAGVLESGW
jgi:hypothetical protein